MRLASGSPAKPTGAVAGHCDGCAEAALIGSGWFFLQPAMIGPDKASTRSFPPGAISGLGDVCPTSAPEKTASNANDRSISQFQVCTLRGPAP